MLRQLLWIEVLLKGGLGLLLFIAPSVTLSATGLPAAANGFWPRLIGALLTGIAAALLLQGTFPNARTITPAGLVMINLSLVAGVVTAQVLGQGCTTLRGRVLVWILAIGTSALALFEIAYA